MSLFKKNIITLFFIGLVYVWFWFPKFFYQAPIVLDGAKTSLALFIEPEAGKTPLIDAINSAQKEILIEVYILSDKDIIDAIINAKKRGLVVRVMLEKSPFGGGSLNYKTKDELETFGIQTLWSNPKFALTHEKAIVIDAYRAFILNQNLTASAFVKNREYNILDENPKDVEQIRNIFISDWQNSPLTLTNSNIINSPENARLGILGLIQQAQNTIDIQMEVIEDNEVIALLCEKAKNTTIRILAPPVSQIASNRDALIRLLGAGVLIRTLSNPYIHAKLILTDNSKAYVGSVNLTQQSLDKNREIGIIVSQVNITSILSTTFSTDWQNANEFK